MKLFSLIVTVLLLTSCVTQMPSEISQKQRTNDILKHVSQELSGTQWRIVRVIDQDVNDAIEATLQFDNSGNVSGVSGCNQYTGEFDRNIQDLTLSALASTRMMCADSNAMNIESILLTSLEKVKTYHITPSGTLVLFLIDDMGSIVAEQLTEE
jgi:heat shock protein HslJ